MINLASPTAVSTVFIAVIVGIACAILAGLYLLFRGVHTWRKRKTHRRPPTGLEVIGSSRGHT
jgi:hypothetical protein